MDSKLFKWAEKIIPGISRVNPGTLDHFLKQPAGQQFLRRLEAIENEVNAQFSVTRAYNWYYGYEPESLKALRGEYQSQAEEFTLIHQGIVLSLLEQIYPDFYYLTDEERRDLANKSYSQFLYKHYALLAENPCPNPEGRQDLIDTWQQFLKSDPALRQQHHDLPKRKIEAELDAIGEQLPAFIRPLVSGKPSLHAQLRAIFQARQGVDEASESGFMEALFIGLLKEFFSPAEYFLGMDTFNTDQGKKLTAAWLNNLHQRAGRQPFYLDQLLDQYEKDLLEHFRKQLLLDLKPSELSRLGSEQYHGLAALLNQPIANAREFMVQLTQAHFLIQIAGMGAQSDNNFLALVQLFGAHYVKDEVNFWKKILFSLLRPLRPLKDEYKDIGAHETNILRKCFRILLPILIAIGFIILSLILISVMAGVVGALLTTALGLAGIAAPVVILPEIAFTLAVIPAVVMGLILASAYVFSKNKVYESLRLGWYGGRYQVPEFQINERMISLFLPAGEAQTAGSRAVAKRKAEDLRQFYIRELSACDRQLLTSNCLNSEQIHQQDEARKYKLRLILEWHDIHNNPEVGVDEAKKIALARMADKEKNKVEHWQARLEASGEWNQIKSTVADRKARLLAACRDTDVTSPIRNACLPYPHFFSHQETAAEFTDCQRHHALLNDMRA